MDAVEVTNEIIAEIRVILSGYEKKNTKLAQEDKIIVLKLIKQYEDKGFYVDYITLSSNLLFSMNYALSFAQLSKETFYFKVRKRPYEAKDYLKDVEVVSSDYKELFNKYKDNKNVVFLVDPPYLSTDVKTYSNHWKLCDYLDVIKVLVNTNYLFFTSNKSQLIELFTWLEQNQTGNPFKEAEVVYRYNATSHNSGYQDIMVCKKWVTNTTL